MHTFIYILEVFLGLSHSELKLHSSCCCVLSLSLSSLDKIPFFSLPSSHFPPLNLAVARPQREDGLHIFSHIHNIRHGTASQTRPDQTSPRHTFPFPPMYVGWSWTKNVCSGSGSGWTTKMINHKLCAPSKDKWKFNPGLLQTPVR